MNCRVTLAVGAWFLAISATARPASLSQDPPASPSQSGPQKTAQPETRSVPSPAERKKTKKVWTNDDLGEVSGSAISQVGDAKNSSSAKSSPATPATSQEVAAYRKQLTGLQAQLAAVEKQIADFKSFSKGEASGSTGMQMHKSYTMEPVEDQVRKLEEKKKSLEVQIDAVFDAARKRGIEPGQLR